MSATTLVEAIHAERSCRDALVEAYREAVRDAMLGEIAAFALDPVFSEIAAELAALLRCEVSEAAEILRPVTHSVYGAAERAL